MKSSRCQNNSKRKARIETVIKPALSVFPNGLPKNKQYWTLCAEQVRHDNSEIVQLVNSGLIFEEQYYGIDSDEELITGNRERFPNANFFHGTFYWQLSSYSFENFNPGVIYMDTTGSVNTQKDDIAGVLNLMTSRDLRGVLVVVNVVMNHRGIKDTPESIMRVLECDAEILKVLNDKSIKTDMLPMWYSNDGSKMFTIHFRR